MDYEPPVSTDKAALNSLAEPEVGDEDLFFDLPPKPSKRARDDDSEGTDKKIKKNDTSALEKELAMIAEELKVTYTVKNTPSGSAMISFEREKTSFSINVKNRKQYETGAKGLLSFSTTQEPDSFSKLVTDHCTPTSTSKIMDVVKIIVSSLTK